MLSIFATGFQFCRAVRQPCVCPNKSDGSVRYLFDEDNRCANFNLLAGNICFCTECFPKAIFGRLTGFTDRVQYELLQLFSRQPRHRRWVDYFGQNLALLDHHNPSYCYNNLFMVPLAALAYQAFEATIKDILSLRRGIFQVNLAQCSYHLTKCITVLMEQPFSWIRVPNSGSGLRLSIPAYAFSSGLNSLTAPSILRTMHCRL